MTKNLRYQPYVQDKYMIRGLRVRKIFGDSKKLDKPSLPTLLFDDEGVSRGARAPAA